MKTLALLAALSLPAFSQTLTFTGPGAANVGSSTPVTLSVTQGSDGAAGVQWSFTLPAGVTLGVPTVANGLSNVLAACGASICLAVSTTMTPFPVGAILSVPLVIASTVAPGSVTFTPSAIVAGDSTATAIPFTAGAGYVLKILSHCDVNGDGTVNVTDIQQVINGVIGTGTCPFAACSLQTVQFEIIASNGGACRN